MNYANLIMILKMNYKKLKAKVDLCEPAEDTKLYKIRRRDLLYQINKFNRVIRQSSIDKYKITYDDINKKYI